MRPRGLLARSAIVLLCGVVLAELGARVLALGPRAYAPRRVEPEGFSPFERTPRGLLVYAPGARWSFVYDPAGDPRGYLGPEGRVGFRTNALGLRGPERSLAKPAGTFRVLCLGDSFTFGEGVRYEDTYPARLESLLVATYAPRTVEVWNAGVQAYGTLQAGELLIARLLAAEPDVVTLGFYLNDATGFERTIEQFEAGLESTPGSGLARLSRLFGIWEQKRRTDRLRGELVETTRASFRSPGWEQCKRAFRALQELAEARGFRLLVAVFPMLWRLEGEYPFEDVHREVVAALEAAGCEHLDLLEAFRGEPSASLWVHATDHHPNDRAHAIAAEEIARRLSTPR